MNRQEIEAIRKRSKAADSGPWVTDWEEMAKKTVLRRLAKYLPMSIEFAQLDAQDAQREFSFGKDVQAIELNPQPAIEHQEQPAQVVDAPQVFEFEEVDEERAAIQAEV